MVGCVENEIKLPEATQIGANTLGCKINGKPFKCIGKAGNQHPVSTPGIRVYYFRDDGILEIDAEPNYGWFSKGESVFFSFKYDGGLGKYTDIEDVAEGSNSYVEITRFSDGIISGYFQMTKSFERVVFSDDKKKHKIKTTKKYTEGRFDVKL